MRVGKVKCEQLLGVHIPRCQEGAGNPWSPAGGMGVSPKGSLLSPSPWQGEGDQGGEGFQNSLLEEAPRRRLDAFDQGAGVDAQGDDGKGQDR